MNASFSQIIKPVSRFLATYHFIIYFIFVISSLSLAMIIITTTVLTKQQDGYASTTNKVTFDETTINKLRGLKDSGEATKTIEITGRPYPF